MASARCSALHTRGARARARSGQAALPRGAGTPAGCPAGYDLQLRLAFLTRSTAYFGASIFRPPLSRRSPRRANTSPRIWKQARASATWQTCMGGRPRRSLAFATGLWATSSSSSGNCPVSLFLPFPRRSAAAGPERLATASRPPRHRVIVLPRHPPVRCGQHAVVAGRRVACDQQELVC